MSQSKLHPFINEINSWIESDTHINDAVCRSEEFIAESNIKPKDRNKMLETIDQWRWVEDPGVITWEENRERKTELVKYLYNALLKFEGMGVR